MARDDFSHSTKEIIAKRAGYLCSFPGCGNITSSSSEEKSSKTSSTGMACHIAAASSGKNAKRFDPNMTPKQRSHADNGIWMCYKHGKLVDNDETRYTTDILNHWKNLAKNIVQYMHENGVEYSEALRYKKNSPLAKNIFKIEKLDNENQIIGNALIDSCIHISWGKPIMNAIRDFLIEITRNALTHGNGYIVNFDFEERKLTLIDDGNFFKISKLLTTPNGQGGKLAYKFLVENYGNNIIITSIREVNQSRTTISLIKRPKEIFEITNCAIEISRQEFKYGVTTYKIEDACQELFVVLPKYITPSDVPRVCENALERETRPIVFIGESLSELALGLIREKYPDSRIINIE